MLGTIQAAIARGRTLGIAYAGKARIVSPIAVEGEIVRCFCLHRREVRSFRLDRITDARIGRPIEAYGPDSLGEPVEIEDMGTIQPAMKISAAVIDLDDLSRRIDAMKPKEAGEVYTKALALKAMVNDFVNATKASMTERVKSGKPVLVATADGFVPLELKPEKKVACNDPAETAWAILEKGGPKALVPLLSSKPVKPEACRLILGDDWKNHFTVTWGTKAEPGKKVLKLANEPEDAEEIVDE